MAKTSYVILLAILHLALNADASAQNFIQQGINAQKSWADAEANGAASDAARRQNAAAKRAYYDAIKRFEKTVIPLSSEARLFWDKKSTPKGPYWQYPIKRREITTAMVYFSPKLGYAVDDKCQKGGLGWPNLDVALEKKFGKEGLWALPDIPGWSKAHLLTSEEHLADMKRKALEQAKSRAIGKISNQVAEGIVEKVGPKLNEEIGKDLGVELPPIAKPEAKKPAGKRAAKAAAKGPQKLAAAPTVETEPLQFKRFGEDKDKVVFSNDASGFLIYKNKDGSGFEVVREEKGESPKWHKFDEVFTSLEAAVKFATDKSRSM